LEAQPADHILIVEGEPGLREIIGAEVRSALGWPVKLCSPCSPEEAKRRSGVAVGAQVFAPAHILGELQLSRELAGRFYPLFGSERTRCRYPRTEQAFRYRGGIREQKPTTDGPRLNSAGPLDESIHSAKFW
jgi:hypothetical protein